MLASANTNTKPTRHARARDSMPGLTIAVSGRARRRDLGVQRTKGGEPGVSITLPTAAGPGADTGLAAAAAASSSAFSFAR
jgi:hypothetical protein